MKSELECTCSSADRFAGIDVDSGHDQEPGYDCSPFGDVRRIRLHFLGQFRILRDGQPLEFQRKPPKKPLALLKLLVASGGSGVDHGAIAGTLWPDADGDAAHRAFEVTLHRLRRLLGVPDVVILSDALLSLHPGKCWTDVREFQALVARIEAAVSAPSDNPYAECMALSGRLLRVYSGHFLEHDGQHAWADACRDRLREKFRRAVTVLASCLERQHAWGQASDLYARALELDNLAEPLYRRLMVCYRELGEDAEALRVYRRCRDLLSVVMCAKPSAETEAVRITLTRCTAP